MNLALSLEAGLKEEDESIHVDLSVDGDHLGMLISLWNQGLFCFPFFLNLCKDKVSVTKLLQICQRLRLTTGHFFLQSAFLCLVI